MSRTRSSRLDATIAQIPETERPVRTAYAAATAMPAEHASTRLIERLLALGAEWPGDEPTRRRLVMAAVEHGMRRRREGEAEDVILADYDCVRALVWNQIREADLPPGQASRTIVGIDAAISLAVAGSLRGYYKDVIERSGDWPLVLERLVWEWRHHTSPDRG